MRRKIESEMKNMSNRKLKVENQNNLGDVLVLVLKTKEEINFENNFQKLLLSNKLFKKGKKKKRIRKQFSKPRNKQTVSCQQVFQVSPIILCINEIKIKKNMHLACNGCMHKSMKLCQKSTTI